MQTTATYTVQLHRLWKWKLRDSYPFWLEAGIRPSASQPGGESWQMLMSTAAEVTKQADTCNLLEGPILAPLILEDRFWTQLGLVLSLCSAAHL